MKCKLEKKINDWITEVFQQDANNFMDIFEDML